MAALTLTLTEAVTTLSVSETPLTLTLAESVVTIGGGGGATNLSWTASTRTVASDTGTDAVITLADGTDAGLMTPADYTKLSGIEASADVTDAANVGAVNAAATSKATPVDADSTPIVDSEASNAIKRVTFTNLKAFLKTYFDTIYTTTSAVASQITTALSGYLTSATAASTYEPLKGADDNFVTDAEKVKLSNLSGTNTGDQDLSGYQATSGKDATGGYAGLTLFKINFKNVANTFTSFFTNSNSAARTYTFPDKDGTVAMTSDITGTNSGTNTGDQTSIVGITGTKAQFDTACSDGNFMYVGDAPTSHTHLLAAGATDVTASAAEVNILDGATLTTTELNYVDGVTSAIQTQLDGKQPLDTQLTDIAALGYTGNSLKVLRVNAGETAFELATPSGGSLTNWTEAYSSGTQATSSFLATGAGSNINAALIPKGTGAIVAAIPDGTTTGGNSRGTYAVDLQMSRSNANQVSQGNYGAIVGGANNRSWSAYGVVGGLANVVQVGSGNYATCFGNANTIADYIDAATAIGRQNYIYNNYGVGLGSLNLITGVAGFGAGEGNQTNANYASTPGGYRANAALYGQQAHASGYFAAVGDAQAHELTFRTAITGTAITELFLDGSSTRAILPSTNTIWQGIVDFVAVTTAVGNGTGTAGDVAGTQYKVTLKRLNTTTTLVGTVQEIGTTNSDTSMATSVFTIDANDTNEALRLQFTPPSATAGSTSTYRVVATFRGTQIKY